MTALSSAPSMCLWIYIGGLLSAVIDSFYYIKNIYLKMSIYTINSLFYLFILLTQCTFREKTSD
jgi:hypothetical protein